MSALAPTPLRRTEGVKATSGRHLPLDTRFTLGEEITPQQWAFLDENGFLIFNQVASQDECEGILSEADRLAARWMSEGRKSLYGIPLFRGKGVDGEEFIARQPFNSVFSDYIREFVHGDRLSPIRDLIGKNTRVGDQEKDGVVLNRYLNVPGSAYPRLGWHTDGLRDLVYLRMPKRMLNVGLHFDRITREDGGLRLIPGSHKQGAKGFLFGKAYFLDHREDPNEVMVETKPGDLTIHDGRLWHRVEQSQHTGARSLRRSMYLPYLTDEFQPKDENSTTPIYHHIGRAMRRFKGLASKL